MGSGRLVSWRANTLQIQGAFRPQHVRNILQCLTEMRDAKQESIVLNFTECTDAFPNSMLPMLCAVSYLRSLGHSFQLALPKERKLKSRFIASHWAKFLAPEQSFGSLDSEISSTVAYNYTTSKEHHQIANKTINSILKTIVSHRSAFGALGWIITEIMDNVLNHAESPVGGYVQLAIFRNTPPKIDFCVADAGKGILASLRQARTLSNDVDAIHEAVRAGVTRDPTVGRGNGLSGSLGLAVASGGWFRIHSGCAQVLWNPESHTVENYSQSERYPGTVVDLQLPLGDKIDLVKILSETTFDPSGNSAKYSPSDYIEDFCLSEKFDSLVIKVAEEEYGSRNSGRELRLKAQNLLAAETEMLLVIDWSGMDVVASSFADEFVGKLAKELGSDGFKRRIKLVGLSETLRSLMDKAIFQRVFIQ